MSEILLLMEHRGNRRLLAEALSPRHNVILPESDTALDGPFDLGVVDGISLDRLGTRIQARKRAEQPALLPFLLVTARQDVGMATRHLWKSINELITSPIDKIELQARVESLLERRRLSQEFHRALVLASPLAVIAVNEDAAIIEWNPAAERIFGWSESEALGQPLFLLTADGRRDEARQLFESVWRGEVMTDVERRERTKDGSLIDVAISAAPLRDAHGSVTQVVALVSDITERKQAEDALQAHTARLELSNRDLQEFAHVASHDLQEPLRKIMVFGERLAARASALDENSKDYLERMLAASQRMQGLINDLLTYSRVQTRAQPFTQVDLAKAAGDAISDLELRIEQTSGRVELGDLPVIEADPTQMRQLFQNLIGNALKFSKPGHPPLVRISAQVADGRCALNVQDNGIGFDPQYLDRVFKPFQRLHTREEYEGTGMGLAIVRRIVERHHGEVTVESALGAGASFIVTLPLVQQKKNPKP